MKASAFIIALTAFFVTCVYGDDINTTDYSTDVYNTIVDAGEMCQISYCIQELDRPAFTTGELSCAITFCDEHPSIDIINVFVAPLNESGTGYIAVDNSEKIIWLVFRGSSTIFDWIVDLTFDAVPYVPLTTDAASNYTCTDCYAHQGFYDTLKLVSDEVFPVIKELKEGNYSDYKVYTSGHSLGGALTNLAGIELALMGYDPLVLSLAGPKIGNEALATYMNGIFDTSTVIDNISNGGSLTSGFIRTVHESDIVPLLPPTDYWYHGGAEFQINKFLLPHPQSVTYYYGDYEYESLLANEINDLIQGANFDVIYRHISYFVSMADCIIGDVFTLFTGLQIPTE